MKTGKLHLVSLGPGSRDLIPPMARSALEESAVIVGYGLYLEAIRPWIEGKEIHALPLTRERERARKAIECARAGRIASLVSSGDVGVYAMAALALEEMREDDAFELNIIPGISAANSCAALLGSPLSHDFATLSLSDLLCPWEWIEHRARHIAEADLVAVLYNVQSRERREGIYKIVRLMLDHKSPRTWCGVVKNAYREGQERHVCTLSELLDREFDMLTTVIIGNRFTRRRGDLIHTPRGYNSWSENIETPTNADADPTLWVFSGTGDGNALAAELARQGHNVIVSAASEYGREVAAESNPGLAIRAGRMGVEARRRELRNSAAAAIVDATHPFATEISRQLMTLADDLDIPYVRYERPSSKTAGAGIWHSSAEAAAGDAIGSGGRRIFLATGAKDLAAFLRHPRADTCQWFARVAPDPDSMQRALDAGIPRARICAMQGPFSREFNEALWRCWNIECVITKDSGDAGGFSAKAAAARALNIPLIVLERPPMQYPRVARTFAEVASLLEQHRLSPQPNLCTP